LRLAAHPLISSSIDKPMAVFSNSMTFAGFHWVITEMDHLPATQSGGALLFHLLSKLNERTSMVITTNQNFSEWTNVFYDAKVTTSLFVRLALHRHIVETGNENWRFQRSKAVIQKVKHVDRIRVIPCLICKDIFLSGSANVNR
jgi:hypothetical protein